MLAQRSTHIRREASSRGLGSLARRIIIIALTLIPLSVAMGCRYSPVRLSAVSPEAVKQSMETANEGDAAFARKDYYAALVKYLEACRLNPNSEYLYNKLGITYSRLKFYPQAIDAFSRSISLNPKYAYSYNNMGSVYFAEANKKKAEGYFKKAISLKNDEASFYINLGTLLWEKKNYEKGLLELRKGLSLDPDILKKSAGDGLEATTTQKNTWEKYYFTARLFAATGDADRAVEDLMQALSAGFTNLEALRTEHDFDPIRQDEKFVAFMKYATQLLKSP
jgi:tetratricopeptide (TPR) repeat protein